MASIFPGVQPVLTAAESELPMCREIKWDFIGDHPVLKNGRPVMVEGAEAVKTWIYNALLTVRYRHIIFPWSYGDEVEILIGQAYTEDTKKAEAIRYVRECLMVNPYITSVNDIRVAFKDTKLTISCKVKTIYGEVSVNV